MKHLIPMEAIAGKILFIRGHKVILDNDLAKMYGVKTKALNQAVRRNISRFPEDFMFQLDKTEKEEVVTICDHLNKIKFTKNLPYGFTEQGVAMLSSVLRSKRAIAVNIMIMRAFVKLRAILLSHAELAGKLEELEKKYDARFKIVFDAIKALMAEPESKPKKQIGFTVKEKRAAYVVSS